MSCASPRRRPASLRASGSRPPRARWARVSAERLPRNSISTWFSASLDAAPSIARAPSAVMPSMSKSTLSSAMSSGTWLRRSAARDATWRGTAAPALPEGLEADHGAGHADVERFGLPRHRDGQGARECTDQLGGEPGGLVAQEEGRRRGPVESGVVLAVAHHRGEGAEAGGGQLGRQLRPGPAARPGARGRANRPTSAPSWGCRGPPSRRRRRPAPTPRRPPPAARCRRCRGPARRRARRPARRHGPTRARSRPAAPRAWGARQGPVAA